MPSSAARESGFEDIKSLADPRLKKLKIGVNMFDSDDGENSPPAMALSRYGVVGNLRGYNTSYDREYPARRHHQRGGQEGHRRGDRLGADGRLLREEGLGAAGAHPASRPSRDSATGFPMQYNIGMAVRRQDKALRDSLQTLLDRRAPDIQAILKAAMESRLFPSKTEAPADSGRAAKP